MPARVVVYFVLGLCLFSGADSMGPPGYRSVWRWLTNGLRQAARSGAPEQLSAHQGPATSGLQTP
ncbi:MAG: transposase domain-containing protein [Pseudonocardiales bacterium]|nr:transposase domain-containing protein [Pseudonocardiales bacterium]